MDHSVSFGGDVNYEYLILGAGPAGLQMGHHLSRAGHSYLILEAGDTPGTFFKTFPRHRTLLSSNKVHTGSTDPELNLRFDWNSLLDEDGKGEMVFTRYSRDYFPPADELVRYLADYAEFYGLNVRCNTRVLRVERSNAGQFRLTDATGGVFTCQRLIVATGASRPYVPADPGHRAGGELRRRLGRSGGLRQPARADPRQGELRAGDGRQPDPDHGAAPHRQPPSAGAGGQQQLPRHLPVEPAERRARLRRREDRAARRPAHGLGPLQPRPGRDRGAGLRPGDRGRPASVSTARSSPPGAGPSWRATAASRRRPRSGSRSTSPASTSPAR